MRWYGLALVTLLAVTMVRWTEPANAGDKKDPTKDDKKEAVKDDPKDAKDAHLYVVPPVGGKEVKLIDWRFSLGTRRLSWLEPAPVSPKTKTPTGPEYLEFREDKSTTYANGILTLVPMSSIKKMDYDREKKNVAVVVATAGKDETLAGTTKFIGANKITIEGDAVLEGLGAATVKFQGGSNDGVHGVRFPNPKTVAPVKGAATTITADDKEKTKHTAFDLQPIYLVDGSYRTLPYVSFKKTVKVDLDKIVRLKFIPSSDKNVISHEFEVTLRDGNKHVLSMLTTIEVDKKKSMTFVGLVGRVPVGYKLFPPHTMLELQVAEEEKK